MNVFAPLVVTLVHGTFDSNARWTLANSAVCSALVHACGPKLIIQSFTWSGKNDHRHRILAARQLSDKLAESSSTFPKSKQIVIAHSHGGNIAVDAVQFMSEKYRRSIARIITISTPFLLLRERKNLSDVPALLFVLRLILMICFFAVWFRIFAVNYESMLIPFGIFATLLRRSDWIIVAWIAYFAVILLIPTYVVSKFLRAVALRLEAIFLQRSAVIVRAYNCIDRSSSARMEAPITCVYTNTDEVTTLFVGSRIIQFASRLAGMAMYAAKMVYDGPIANFIREFKWAFAYLSIFPLFLLFAGEMSGHEISRGIIGSIAIPLVYVFIVLTVATCFVILIGIHVFGLRGWADFLCVEAHHSLRPLRADNVIVEIVPSRRIRSYLRGANTHTDILYDPEVASIVARHCRSVKGGSV